MEEHPDLLIRLGDFEIQVLYLGIQKNMVGSRLALKAAGLALGIKHYRRLLERLMVKLYEAYPDVSLLEALCSILIKGERKNRDAFEWYEKALEQGLT